VRPKSKENQIVTMRQSLHENQMGFSNQQYDETKDKTGSHSCNEVQWDYANLEEYENS
jgi:hypothetical protein